MSESDQKLSEEELKELADLEAEEEEAKRLVEEKLAAEEEARRNKKGLKFDRNVFYNGKEYQVGNAWKGEVPDEIKEYLK